MITGVHEAVGSAQLPNGLLYEKRVGYGVYAWDPQFEHRRFK